MMKRTVVLIVAGLAMSGFSVLQFACGGGDRAQEPPPVAQVALPAAPAPEAPPPPASAAAPAPVAPAPAPAPRPAARPPSQNAAQAPAPAAVAPAPAPAAPPLPPPPPPRQFTLRQGTPLSVFTTSTISTSANKPGEAFNAVLAKSIVDGDWVIAKQGARVEGVVVESDPGGKVKGVASLTLALRRLTLADGRTIELDTDTFIQEAKTTKGKDAKKVGIGAGIGAAIGAIAGGGKGAAIGAAVGGGGGAAASLATRGDAAEVASETELRFTLTSPITITERK
ncbi:MAG TPA: hypothetical protein VM846_11935 [Vicinamibacterales bacterium]|nr:hypothetical protein [Vicinamibacterales bacterium]